MNARDAELLLRLHRTSAEIYDSMVEAGAPSSSQTFEEAWAQARLLEPQGAAVVDRLRAATDRRMEQQADTPSDIEPYGPSHPA